LSADGRWAVIVDPHQGRLHVHDLARAEGEAGARRDVALQGWPKNLDHEALRVAVDVRGELLVMICGERTPRVFNVRSGASMQQLKLPRDASALRVSVPASGERILIEHDEGVSIFSEGVKTRHEPWVCAAISPDGQRGAFVSREEKGHVYLTDGSLSARGGHEVRVSREADGYAYNVKRLRFAPDGERIIIQTHYNSGFWSLHVGERRIEALDLEGDDHIIKEDILTEGITHDGSRLVAHVAGIPDMLHPDDSDERFVEIYDLEQRALLGVIRLYVKEPSCIGLRLYQHGLAVPRGQEQEVIAREGGLFGMFHATPEAPSPDDPRVRTAQALARSSRSGKSRGWEGPETIPVFETTVGVFGRLFEDRPLGFEAPVMLEDAALTRRALLTGARSLEGIAQTPALQIWRDVTSFLATLRDSDLVEDYVELAPVAQALEGASHLAELAALCALREPSSGGERRFGAGDDDDDDNDSFDSKRYLAKANHNYLMYTWSLVLPAWHKPLRVGRLISAIEELKQRGPEAGLAALRSELERGYLNNLVRDLDDDDEDEQAASALTPSATPPQTKRPLGPILTLYAPEDDAWPIPMMSWSVAVGDRVSAGQELGSVSATDLWAPCDGIVSWLADATLGHRIEPGARLASLELDPSVASRLGLEPDGRGRVETTPILAPESFGRIVLWGAKVGEIVRRGQPLAHGPRGDVIESPCDGLLLQIFTSHGRLSDAASSPLGLIHPLPQQPSDALTPSAGDDAQLKPSSSGSSGALVSVVLVIIITLLACLFGGR
jgi:biotin carboxyl carrier protein